MGWQLVVCGVMDVPLHTPLLGCHTNLPMTEEYLLDVAVYRENVHAFQKSGDRAVEACLHRAFDNQGLSRSKAPETAAKIEESAWNDRHAPWQFNQIVGWVRLYILGDSVRGESWWTTERSVRRRPTHRRIEFFGNAFELSFSDNESDAQIATAIRTELLSCVLVFPRRGVSIDLEIFDNLAPLLPWNILLTDHRVNSRGHDLHFGPATSFTQELTLDDVVAFVERRK